MTSIVKFYCEETGLSFYPIAGGDGTPPPAAPPAAPPVAPPVTPPAAPPAASVAFDWKTSGVDDVGMALVNDRQWKGVPDLLTSYRSLEKFTGVPPERIVKIPKSNDAAEWDMVYDKLGRPKDASGYKLPVPEGDKGEFAAEASKWMHEHGLSEAQGRGLAEKWNGHLAAMNKAYQEKTMAENAKQVAELKGEWGANYQANTEIVDKAAQSFGMSQDHLSALKVAMGPKAAMNFMYNIGSKIAVEDKTLIRNPDGSPSFKGMTPEIARSEITRLQADKSFAQQFNSQDPKTRAEARDRMKNLQTMAYPPA